MTVNRPVNPDPRRNKRPNECLTQNEDCIADANNIQILKELVTDVYSNYLPKAKRLKGNDAQTVKYTDNLIINTNKVEPSHGDCDSDFERALTRMKRITLSRSCNKSQPVAKTHTELPKSDRQNPNMSNNNDIVNQLTLFHFLVIYRNTTLTDSPTMPMTSGNRLGTLPWSP